MAMFIFNSHYIQKSSHMRFSSHLTANDDACMVTATDGSKGTDRQKGMKRKEINVKPNRAMAPNPQELNIINTYNLKADSREM